MENKAGSGRNVDLQRARPAVKLPRGGEEVGGWIDSAMTAEIAGVGIKHDLIFSGTRSPNAVIGITGRPVEVEDEHGVGTIEHDNFVADEGQRGHNHELKLRNHEKLTLMRAQAVSGTRITHPSFLVETQYSVPASQ